MTIYQRGQEERQPDQQSFRSGFVVDAQVKSPRVELQLNLDSMQLKFFCFVSNKQF